jgi:hypothetical protein
MIGQSDHRPLRKDSAHRVQSWLAGMFIDDVEHHTDELPQGAFL